MTSATCTAQLSAMAGRAANAAAGGSSQAFAPGAREAATPVPAGRSAQPLAPAKAPARLDRRSARSQRMLRAALAAELNAGEDLTRITVAALTEHAGLTRRTFYTHYRDIPDFVEQVEEGVLAEIRTRLQAVAAADLDSLYDNISQLEPAPGAVELLGYLKEEGALIGALLGPGGDAAFAQRIQAIARETVAGRMKMGIFPGVLGAFFDYYLSYVVAAETGVVQRWFETGLKESPETMARIMTVVAFVRPGDLYGKPIDINVPEYGMKLMGLNLRGPASHDTRAKEAIDG